MKLSVAIWAQCDRIFDRVFTVVCKSLLMVHLEVWGSVFPPKKRSKRFATLTSAICSKQDLRNNVSAPNVDLRDGLDLCRPFGGSCKSLSSCRRCVRQCSINVFVERGLTCLNGLQLCDLPLILGKFERATLYPYELRLSF
ncbi:hypothetical protein WI41_14525 [Burkholderia latens]|uniref:Uncharacterized protein n=1 Tax=Burkholderia latens TaxID=488446 RepID=A0AAP1C5V5_9BURK|nr:hypothetical protein WI41_14525 [Burkholderia latens]